MSVNMKKITCGKVGELVGVGGENFGGKNIFFEVSPSALKSNPQKVKYPLGEKALWNMDRVLFSPYQTV